MVATDRLTKLIKNLEKSVGLTKRIFSIAPEIVPTALEAFVFLPEERISDELHKVIKEAPEDKQEYVCDVLERTVAQFEATVLDMENRIKARQQPKDLPRREGPRPFKQFKPRKAEW